MSSNWFRDLFIEEAKAAIEFRNNLGDGSSGSGGGSDENWLGDGNTHIWITLPEGRTSPMLGCCPKGTVTVDWGDGSEPDVLTGADVTWTQWTPTHNYANPGDYVITLTVDGEMGLSGSSSNDTYAGILRYTSTADKRNRVYQSAVRRVELGNGVTSIGTYAFTRCYALTSITIPDSVTSIGNYAFNYCYALTSITIPDSVTSIGTYAFSHCYALASITIPDSVTRIDDNVFSNCYTLTSITIPDSVTIIGTYAFNHCDALASITIPDSVTSIGNYAFNYCYALASITIPDSVTSIATNVFSNCYAVRYLDFTNHTTVLTLANTNAFNNIPSDCEIRVPAALYDEWIAATNWATYASQIIAV